MNVICIGIWADDSDDEPETKNNHRNSNKPKNYSAPIGFVTGGMQQAGKKTKQPELKHESDDEDKPGTSFRVQDSSESEEEAPKIGKRSLPPNHHFLTDCPL